ncbi:MAG TPA: hypothetical protein VF486_27820 [Actinomycetes bacterium]
MVDPASLADWVQASCMAGVVVGLAAAGRWALAQDQRESSAKPVPESQVVAVARRR